MGRQALTVGDAQLTIRDATEADLGFVFATWMESARMIQAEKRHVDRDIFDSFYPDVVRTLMNNEPVVVAQGEQAIHAWACGRPPNLLHFAYVPHKLRHNGIGRALITAVLDGYPATIFVTSSPTRTAIATRFRFNPYVLRSS